MLVFFKGVIKTVFFLFFALMMMYSKQNPELLTLKGGGREFSSISDDFNTWQLELTFLNDKYECTTGGYGLIAEEFLLGVLLDFVYDQIRDHYIHYNSSVIDPHLYCERDIEDYFVLFTDESYTHRCRMELFQEFLNP